jgi:hypothetical protein
MWNLNKGELIKAESRRVGTRGWEGDSIEEMLVKGYKTSIRRKKFKRSTVHDA